MDDILYEFKQELYGLVTSKEMPEDVKKFADIVKQNLKTVYANKNLLDENMEQYIDGQFEEIKPYIAKLQETKNEQDFEKINSIISQISLRVEPPTENEKAFDMEPMSDMQYLGNVQSRISAIDTRSENQKASKDLISILADIIEDIRNHANRRIEMDEAKYEELNYEISQLKNYMLANMIQGIEDSFDKQDKELLNEVYQKFEKYFYMAKDIKENGEQEKTFREELDAGISLEEQSENAKAFMDKLEDSEVQEKSEEEKEEGGLPDNVIW